MKKRTVFIESLELKNVGWLEIAFAFTLLLSGYNLSGLPLSLFSWMIVVVIAFVKNRRKIAKLNAMTVFIAYWIVHSLFIMMYDSMNIGSLVQQIILFIAFYITYPNMDIKKLCGSLNWVAIIAIVGLLFQWLVILRGGMVHQLEIPGLTIPKDLLERELARPSSFYGEPAAYVAFMMAPLAISLIKKNYIWTIIIILSVFLTTSTTGIAVTFIMIAVSLLSQRISKMRIVALVVVGVSMAYSLTHFSIFEGGMDKLENTDIETNIRIAQGPYIVGTMKSHEFIFGTPYETPYHYCLSGRAPNVIFYRESVYMSTIWYLILCFGLIGVLLYLNIYFQIAKRSRLTWPLIACLLATLFTATYRFSGTFIFMVSILMMIVNNEGFFIGNDKQKLTKRN